MTEVDQQNDQALAESGLGRFDLYRTLFDSIDEGFCVIRFIDGPEGPLSDYVHIEANAAYADNAGIPDVVGQRLREMVGDEADAWVARYGEVLRTGQPIRFEQELIATRRHLELSAFRLGTIDERLVAVLFKDVTARRKAEEESRALHETLEARVTETLAERKVLADMIESATALAIVIAPDGRWIGINQAAADAFERGWGVRPEIGQRIEDVLGRDSDYAVATRARWNRALAGEVFTDTVVYGDPEHAGRSFEMRFSPLRDANGAIVGAFLLGEDVTERLAGQQRLAAAEEALRQAQKMEAVGQLTGGLAHDFNNLLAGVSGALEMIGVRTQQGRIADVDRYLSAAQGAVRRAAALTHRLLAFSRRQTLTPKAIVINRLMNDLAELVRRTVGPNITVETVAAAGLWPALVDANQLENAILNLCINARDAMPDGGRITIETGNRWIDERVAAEHGLDAGQYVTMCVSDTGTGIEKDVLERVFDPFFTTKPLGEGTGLGLSMVYGFARQSNGHVRIYSEPGQGTMVCLYLPRHAGEEDVEDVPDDARAACPAAGGVVLVVDDEPTVRMLVVDALADRDYVCIEAADGPAGLRALKANPGIDLLITDVGLPGGLNGRQVADAAREVKPDLRVLFITGYAENAALNHGHIARGMEILTKPFAVGELVRRVERLMRD